MADDDHRLGERYLIISAPKVLQLGACDMADYLAVLGADGTARVLRRIDEGDDRARLLEWLQPDCDGIRSGQLNWQLVRQRELMRQTELAAARAEAAKLRRPPPVEQQSVFNRSEYP